MIVQCSECSCKFLVPDAAVGADGRRVKCGKCGHIWHVKPEIAPTPEDEALAKANEQKKISSASTQTDTVDDTTASKKSPGTDTPDFDKLMKETDTSVKPSDLSSDDNKVPSLAAFWSIHNPQLPFVLTSIVLFVWLILLSLFAFMPEIIGYNSSKGLELQNLTLVKAQEKGKGTYYYIKGEINNTTDTELTVPKVRITALSVNNESLAEWEFEQESHAALPYQPIQFQTGPLTPVSNETQHYRVELGNEWELKLRR